MLLIVLVFCVVVFGGIRVAHRFSFLCCVFLFCLSSSCVSGLSILDCPFGFL